MLVWQYVLVFLAAAFPLLEVLVVIPGAVAAGLHPIPVGIVAFLGNVSTVALVVLGADRLAQLIETQRAGKGAGPSARRERQLARVRRIAQRWGLPGVAVLAPLTTGTHVAAFAAVALRLPKGVVLAWSVAGVGGWSAFLAAAAAMGRTLF